MYLKYISDEKIAKFISKLTKSDSNAKINVVRSGNQKSAYVFTNLRNTQFCVTDFQCINIPTGEDYSKYWYQFMVKQLDNVAVNFGTSYINDYHDYVEQNYNDVTPEEQAAREGKDLKLMTMALLFKTMPPYEKHPKNFVFQNLASTKTLNTI